MPAAPFTPPQPSAYKNFKMYREYTATEQNAFIDGKDNAQHLSRKSLQRVGPENPIPIGGSAPVWSKEYHLPNRLHFCSILQWRKTNIVHSYKT